MRHRNRRLITSGFSAVYVPNRAGAYLRTGFTGTTVRLLQRGIIDLYYSFVGDSITLGTTSSQVALTAYGWLTGEGLGAEHTQLGYGGGCLLATPDGCTSVAAQFLHTGYSATRPSPGGWPRSSRTSWDRPLPDHLAHDRVSSGLRIAIREPVRR